MTPQTRRGFVILATGLLLGAITNMHNWIPQVVFKGKDWSVFLHDAVLVVAMVLAVIGIILLVRAKLSEGRD
ncbi:MAG: hypothetical protein ACLPH3_05870 [Terracidiphilus sp.]